MSLKVSLFILFPGILIWTYYYSVGSVKEAEEYDRLSPEEAKQRFSQLLLRMDLNGDQFIDRSELKQWFLKTFR